jgi:hypothetical protein
MLTKINRQDCLNKYPSFPLRIYNYQEDEYDNTYPKVFKSYILTLSSKTFSGHILRLARNFTKLANDLRIDTFTFLGDIEIPWLNQNNDYKPAKEAQLYLKTNRIGKRFNGAIQVDTSQLPEFTKHLCWLIRCNASLPCFYFIDPGQNVIGNICQYGNLHMDTLNAETDKTFNAALKKSRFTLLKNNNCFNQFGKTSAISGRQIIA